MLKRIKEMKLWKKILWCVVLVIIISGTALTVWQWNNIRAIIVTFTKDEQQIAGELDETKEKLQNELKDQYSSVVRDFTAEEEKQIMKGEITADEAVSRLAQEYQEIKEKYNIKSTGNAETDKKVDNLVGDKIIELYSLKAYYLGQLGQLEATVKREYSALPKEKRNAAGKKELAGKHIGYAYALMEQCDAKVAALVGELQAELKALKADTSIIKVIQNTYENEKALKKAYYLKLLGV